MKSHRSLASWCFVWLAAMLNLSADLSAAERNIVFVITDDESPTLGCYGDKFAKTPAIDSIAADGVVFRNAFATTASCSASRSVILSGLHNHRNGQFGHEHHYHKFLTFEEVGRLSLPNVLRQSGYRTGHIGKYHVGPESVYHFDTYLKGNGRNAVDMANNCEEFIKSNDNRPFFLYFATADPHRGGGVDNSSQLELKPDLFGNKPNRGSFPGVTEQFFSAADVPVPAFLPDTLETREELAHYYQSCSRVDAGVARLIQILKSANLYDKTLIVFTSDHGMAFSGSKTTVYEPGLRVPMVVRDPYQSRRGFESTAMLSHIDITPTLLDYAGGLVRESSQPKNYGVVPNRENVQANAPQGNTNGGQPFNAYHGRSWLPSLADPAVQHWDTIFASHTFHEIQMYYPMRVVRDSKYKLIWNIAHPLPYPFASDLWDASSWQAQFRQGQDAKYGTKTVGQYIQRPKFELFDMQKDPHESSNLADLPQYKSVLTEYQAKLKEFQKSMSDPWIMKWDYE
jgi:N-sulfoglucosamine sulfohydrolase